MSASMRPCVSKPPAYNHTNAFLPNFLNVIAAYCSILQHIREIFFFRSEMWTLSRETKAYCKQAWDPLVVYRKIDYIRLLKVRLNRKVTGLSNVGLKYFGQLLYSMWYSNWWPDHYFENKSLSAVFKYRVETETCNRLFYEPDSMYVQRAGECSILGTSRPIA